MKWNHFVYLLVTFHTFQNQEFLKIQNMPNSAEKWIGVQKSNKTVRKSESACRKVIYYVLFCMTNSLFCTVWHAEK